MNSNKLKYLIFILILALIASASNVDATTGGGDIRQTGGGVPQSTGGVDSVSTGATPSKSTGLADPGKKPSSSVTIDKLQNPLKGINSIGELIRLLIQIFTYIAIIFAVLAFIYLGLQYVIYAAQGNSKIKELHERLLWLVIGVAIVIGARVIIEIAINTLSATGTVDTQIIDSAKDALSQTKNQ